MVEGGAERELRFRISIHGDVGRTPQLFPGRAVLVAECGHAFRLCSSQSLFGRTFRLSSGRLPVVSVNSLELAAQLAGADGKPGTSTPPGDQLHVQDTLLPG